ncbi:TlpA family protein disulfide reductase [Ekhidna sp.]|uniref:TlpA family protein disulfide reductase n=1 Tax=Ekhidna sp. TaxID=2608089 RepID=UPI003B507DEE
MNRIEIIIFSILALITSNEFLNYSSSIGFLASIYQLLVGFTFFVLNATLGSLWLQKGKITRFAIKSFIPFLLAYFLCVILHTAYWLSLSENASFQLWYTLRPFPHKESMMLVALYCFGLLYGGIKNNKKVLKITLISLLGVISLVIILYVQALNKNLPKINEVEFIEDRYTSIEELLNLPQFANRTVYVDLWYSSCSPCIEQFKSHLPELKSRLDPNKVSFLYLARETSHLDSKQRWIEAISKYQLKGWHYYFSKGDEQMIWDEIRTNIKIELYGYPHYLIARNGKIISYNAPKPSEIEKVLKALSSIN